jgi:hypothetical protein
MPPPCSSSQSVNILRHVAPPFVVNAMYAGTLSTLGYELQVVAGSTTVTKLV